MGFESPDNLQISTRLGKPSTEKSPEVIATPETPVVPIVPEQDDFKISTRLQSEATQKAPAELAEPASVTKIENPTKGGVLDSLTEKPVSNPEANLQPTTKSDLRSEAAPTEPTEPYIDPYGQWEDFRGHHLMGNGETERGSLEIGQSLYAKPELLKLLPELAPIKSFRIVGFTDDDFVIVQIDGGKVRGYAIGLIKGYFETGASDNTNVKGQPALSVEGSAETVTSEQANIAPELTAQAEAILVKLDGGDSLPSQLTKGTEEILRAYGFSQDDINSKTPQDLLTELRARIKPSPNQAEAITESEWQTIEGDKVTADTRLERNGMHVGDYLKLSNARQGLFGPIIESATTLQIVGFTDEGSDDRVIVQIDHDRVRLIYGWDINKYFELTSTPEAARGEEPTPETKPQPEEQTPESKDTLESATEAETSAESEPLTQYLDIGDKVKIITESGTTEEDWTIEDIYTMSLASREVERAVIINTQGTHRTIEMSQLEAWNPAPEQPVEAEAEPDRSFHEGEEVLIMSDETGELESGWHITYVSETVMGQKIFGFADVENAEGVTKRIALSTLRAWNTEKKPTTTETTASVEISVELTNKNKPEHYSAEWIAQTLKQFNIDPEKLEGFRELTDGQKALIVENFQSIMADEVEQRAATGLKQNKKFGIFGKMWRSTFKAVYMGKGRETALSGLETGDSALKETILKQFISGMKQQQPEIKIEHGRLTSQYVTAEKLGLEGPLTPLQDVAVQRFNQAANDLARMPAEWQLTGDKNQQEKYAQQTAIFQQYSEGLLREISKTKDAPAVELSLLQAHRDIRMQQFLTAHPDVEQALMNIKSPKLWWERLKPYFAGSGYLASGAVRNIAFSHATGVLATFGAPLAAVAVGGMRAHNRSQETLRDRDRLARKGAKDTSTQRLNVQDVESEIAGGQAGLVTKLENLKQRFETETDPVKRADLQARLRRRIDYTGYKLDKGLVNFGATDERVVNHFRLMQTMGASMESLWSAKPRLKPDQYTALEKKHYDVSDKLEHFMENQLSRIKTERKRYIFWQTVRGAVMAGGLSYVGHLLTAHADQARPDHDDILSSNHGHEGLDSDHLRQAAGNNDTAVVSPFQTASQTTSIEGSEAHLPTSMPTEHFTEKLQSGDSVWKATERLLSDRFKDKFQSMNEAQRTYLVDAIKDKIQAHPEQYGLDAGQSIDHIQVGQTINFDAVMKDHSITDLLFDHAKSLNPEQMASIVHNNEIIHHWIINNPSEALTADNVDSILQGTHYLGLTPQALDQAIADGGSKVLSIDQGLSPASTTEIINQILYGHPHGQEALMAQVKEALHDTHYLEAIDKAQHYDSGHMTAGWLQTLRGREWLDHHDGDVWNQDGAVYTVVKDVPAKTAKSLLARAYEAAKDQLESAGIPDEKEPELVSFASNLAGKTVDAIYRIE